MGSKQHWHDVATRRGEELRAMSAELEAARALNAELAGALRYLRQQAGMSDLPDSNNAMQKAGALLARLPK